MMSADLSTAEFLREAWYPTFWSFELRRGELVPRTVLDTALVFLRDEHGSVSALSDACPHRGAPLHLGRAMPGGGVRCGYHGLVFDAQGRCVDNPHGDRRVPASMTVRRYPVVERGSLVWTWMGEGPADTAGIPDLSLMEEGQDDGLTRARDSMRMDAHYLLLADNLLDLSHANYLHEGLLGFPEHSDARIEVEQQGDTVVCRRRMQAVAVPRMHDLLFKRDGRPVDMWNEITWAPAGCLTLTHGLAVPGTEPRDGMCFTAVHLLTPETADTTHYLFGLVRRASADEHEVAAEVAEMRRHAFEQQDQVMLVQQHRNLRRLPDFRPTMLGLDAASVRMRRVMAQRIAAQAPQTRRSA
jgi:vanillate O-demethylase monooxygenase subunit